MGWHYGGLIDTNKRKWLGRAAPKLHLIIMSLMLITICQSTPVVLAALTEPPFHTLSLKDDASNGSSLLQCLQVTPPVFSPPSECRQTLMEHTFARSYGQPFVAEYQPPDCAFNRVTINLTVTSAGRQFDRLAVMFLGDVEVFRTSTAEPTKGGIVWSHVKDMSSYLALWKTPQKIIFDLGNLIDDKYTASWNTTLTATFFTAQETIAPAHAVIPVSARKAADNLSSVFVVPQSRAVDTVVLPQNVNKAVFSISACGQGDEEFWWSNVLSSDTAAFGNASTLYGYSPFREVRLLIDGQLAGLAWPFPIIFTGGIVPALWRPVVGIDAFDLVDDEIDITPFIPLLNDGKDHTFEIQVVGIDDDGKGSGKFTTAIGSNWVVTGKVFVWVDSDDQAVTGTGPRSASVADIRVHSTPNHGTDDSLASLDYTTQVTRSLQVESTLHTAGGSTRVAWSQNMTFSTTGTLSNKGNDQIVQLSSTGRQAALTGYSRSFRYPLWVGSSYQAPPNGNVTIDASIRRGKWVEQLGNLAFANDWQTFNYRDLLPSYSGTSNRTFAGTAVRNTQKGTGSYLAVPGSKVAYGSGTTEQHLALSGINSESPATMVPSDCSRSSAPGPPRRAAMSPPYPIYERRVVAANNSVVYDSELYGGDAVHGLSTTFTASSEQVNRAGHSGAREFAQKRIKAVLERGPA